jgi:hypothetical protein
MSAFGGKADIASCGILFRHPISGKILMPTYIMLVNFTDQGSKGVKEVPNRQDKTRETAKQFGVERKTVWMTFGPYDFVHVYEAPNDEAMATFCDDNRFLWLCSHDGDESVGRVRASPAYTGVVMMSVSGP